MATTPALIHVPRFRTRPDSVGDFPVRCNCGWVGRGLVSASQSRDTAAMHATLANAGLRVVGA